MRNNTWINLIAALGLHIASFGVVPLKLPIANSATITHAKLGGSTSPGC